MYQDLSMCHYWLVKKAFVNLPIRQKKGNLKHFMTSNPLSRSVGGGGATEITLALLLMLVTGLDYNHLGCS